jgi:hypothetical protein
MKTLKSIQTRINQINNNSLTLKNQKVMKTKKYSISMKALAALVFTFAFTVLLNAQFVTPAPGSNANVSPEEVRATSTISYDLNLNHTPGDSYRWVVRGGTIDDAGGTLTVTPSGDSSIVEFLADLVSINVNWDTDITATPIGSALGEIIVQKTVGGACASELQTLGITMWNPATANLDLTGLTIEMCSGETLGGNLPVDLTGAPDLVADGFDVTYTVVATGGLTDLLGVALDGTGTTIQDNDELAQIALPAGIVNPTGADQTLTITITAMLVDFDEGGTIGATDTYLITVHPTPSTGEINSSSSLTRR